MPVLVDVTIEELLGGKKHSYEQVAWAQVEDDAFGFDRFLIVTSVLRQIYKRFSQGSPHPRRTRDDSRHTRGTGQQT